MTEGFHYIEEQRAAIFEALECEPSEDLIRGLESIINRVLQDKETLKELKEIPTQGEVGKKIEKLKKALEAIIEVSPFIIDQLKSAYDSVWTPTEQEAMQFMDLEEMARDVLKRNFSRELDYPDLSLFRGRGRPKDNPLIPMAAELESLFSVHNRTGRKRTVYGGGIETTGPRMDFLKCVLGPAELNYSLDNLASKMAGTGNREN